MPHYSAQTRLLIPVVTLCLPLIFLPLLAPSPFVIASDSSRKSVAPWNAHRIPISVASRRPDISVSTSFQSFFFGKAIDTGGQIEATIPSFPRPFDIHYFSEKKPDAIKGIACNRGSWILLDQSSTSILARDVPNSNTFTKFIFRFDTCVISINFMCCILNTLAKPTVKSRFLWFNLMSFFIVVFQVAFVSILHNARKRNFVSPRKFAKDQESVKIEVKFALCTLRLY